MSHPTGKRRKRRRKHLNRKIRQEQRLLAFEASRSQRYANLAASMTVPIRRLMDYAGLARRVIQVEPMPGPLGAVFYANYGPEEDTYPAEPWAVRGRRLPTSGSR